MFLFVEVLLVLAVLGITYVVLRLLLWLIAGKRRGLLWLILGDNKPKPTEPSDLLQQVTTAKQRALELQHQYDTQQQELKEKKEKLSPLTDTGSADDTSGH